MKKHTKIVATIGPASGDFKSIRALYAAGMNAARINLSHGDRTSQTEYIRNIRQLDPNFPIIMDTKGPEIRTGKHHHPPFQARRDQTVRLVAAPLTSQADTLCIDYPHLHEIAIGSRILFDDGLVESEVVESKERHLVIQMRNDGPIGPGKKVTIQGYRVKLPFLTEEDKADLLFAIEHQIALIAASFVRCAQDLLTLRNFISAHNARMMIIAKIEHREALENLDEILPLSDGIMVARGDLGVELPLQEIPGIQEKIIIQCNHAGIPVIVATQMLESMRTNPRPTRAEVNDVAHAILQGADAVMLSAETATGAYPVRSVEMMHLIARQYESQVKGIVQTYGKKQTQAGSEIAQYIAKAAYYASEELDIQAVITPTESGFTARNISRFRPKCPILASTRDPMVVQLLHLVWGVIPMRDTESFLDLKHYDMSYHLICCHFEAGILDLEDRIIITSGSNLMTKRGTNLLEIYAVKDIVKVKVKSDQAGTRGN